MEAAGCEMEKEDGMQSSSLLEPTKGAVSLLSSISVNRSLPQFSFTGMMSEQEEGIQLCQIETSCRDEKRQVTRELLKERLLPHYAQERSSFVDVENYTGKGYRDDLITVEEAIEVCMSCLPQLRKMGLEHSLATSLCQLDEALDLGERPQEFILSRTLTTKYADLRLPSEYPGQIVVKTGECSG
jgi:hypothetical protein